MTITTLIIIVHVLVSIFLIGIVLLQHGKGADIGASFGGSSQSLFGTEGPVPLLNKITTFSAIIFMCTSITLAYISANKSSGTIMDDVRVEQEQKVDPADMNAATIPLPEEADNSTSDQTEEAAK